MAGHNLPSGGSTMAMRTSELWFDDFPRIASDSRASLPKGTSHDHPINILLIPHYSNYSTNYI